MESSRRLLSKRLALTQVGLNGSMGERPECVGLFTRRAVSTHAVVPPFVTSPHPLNPSYPLNSFSNFTQS